MSHKSRKTRKSAKKPFTFRYYLYHIDYNELSDYGRVKIISKINAMQSETSSRYAAISAIAYHLPPATLTNEDIARGHPDWSVEKIYDKTGIACRHIAAPEETPSDLGVEAARKLFASGACGPEDIDLLVFCTQTPDYALPTTACLIQDRLGIPTTCAAFDFNLGCSGFVYGLSIIKGMLENGLASKALLITAETYSKWIHDDDRSVKTIFGDGAAATLIELTDSPDGREPIGPFVFGTDGSGYERLIVHESGARRLDEETRQSLPEGCRPGYLYMDGPEIFSFTIRTVPRTVKALLEKAGCVIDDVDIFIFHQANSYILEHLRKRCKIPAEKFIINMKNCGNTISSTLPIALKDISDSGMLKPGMTVAIVGFGVGYSWAAATITWKG